VSKPGNFPEAAGSDIDRRTLATELQRLRKAGLTDIALRPRRYPVLIEKLAAGGDMPSDTMGRLAFCQRAFEALIDELPTAGMRTAAGLLFHVGSGSTPPPLDDRRRAADRAYTGRSYAREPDTVQRHLEHAVLDPLLIHALIHLSPLPDVEPAPRALRGVDYESWTDDLDRALVYLNRQDFRATGVLLQRWLSAYSVADLDEPGLYLRGRSLMMQGDMRRYQSLLMGPLSAAQSYREATCLFTQLNNPRRLAQIELSQAITTEMSGEVSTAAAMYRQLANDQRLRDYERAQARLWIGTALTKAGDIAPAVREIEAASREFEEQGEPDDWGVAHQKHALAHLAAGDLAKATRSIGIAMSYRHNDSPLEQIRLDTAHGHVLVMDKRTRAEGLAVLDQAREQASRHGLMHQLQWILKIRRIPEDQTGGRSGRRPSTNDR
jgi:tetratricopeptide (TPR) repeat protein